MSSRCSKRIRTRGYQANLAKYPRPNTVLTSNPERSPSAPCPTGKAPSCATRKQPKSERCPTQALSNPQPPNGHHQSSSYRRKTVPRRFCVDYRRLHAKTVADAYPLPRIDDCLDSLGDAQMFTTLDRNAGYWQVSVAPEDRDKTRFTSYLGTYRYVRMPFGLRKAPSTCQQALNIILSGSDGRRA